MRNGGNHLSRAERELGPGEVCAARRVVHVREHAFEIASLATPTAVADDLARSLDGCRALLVTTPTVQKLHGHALLRELKRRDADVETYVLPVVERTKSMEAVVRVCTRAAELALGRNDVLIALSGGVCSDVVTLAASLIRRGVRHMRVPTTLLAQVDAGVGIKGAVHLAHRKNHLGCFHPPSRVLICPGYLDTLECRLVRSGMGEIVKVALAKDAELFRRLENTGAELAAGVRPLSGSDGTRLIWDAIHGLLDELEPNLFEDRSLVRTMDLGHTFSPWLEAASGFSVLHGEAVAFDIALCTTLARLHGWMSVEDESRVLALLDALGLETTSEHLSVDGCSAALEEATRHRGGALNLFLPTGIGSVRCSTRGRWIDRSKLGRALERLMARGLSA